MEGLDLALGAEGEGVNDLINEIIEDVFREFKIKTWSSRWGSGLNNWYDDILESKPNDEVSIMKRWYSCSFGGKGKCFEIPKAAISDRYFNGREWVGSHFSSIKYVSDNDYGLWRYFPTEDTKDKVKAYQEKLRKKYDLPIELFVEGTYHDEEYGYEPSLVMGVSLGKSEMAAETLTGYRSKTDKRQMLDELAHSIYKKELTSEKVFPGIRVSSKVVLYPDGDTKKERDLSRFQMSMKYSDRMVHQCDNCGIWATSKQTNNWEKDKSREGKKNEIVYYQKDVVNPSEYFGYCVKCYDNLSEKGQLGSNPFSAEEEYKVADEDWAGQSCEDCYEEIKVGDSVHDDGDVLICKKCYSNYKIPCEHDACDERFKDKSYEEEHRQEQCNKCNGEGWIMTYYTPATYHDPADVDGEDCEECEGEGWVCDKFNAESFSAEGEHLWRHDGMLIWRCANCGISSSHLYRGPASPPPNKAGCKGRKPKKPDMMCEHCETGIVPSGSHWCRDCGVKRRGPKGYWSAESFSAESNGDLQLDESKKRTKMSMIRTGLAITTFGIVLFNLWTNKKQEKDISDIMDLV